MPQIKLDRKVFEKLVGKKLPLSKLKDRISYLGTDLDDVTDTEIDVEIFPNRPDLLSEQGFARAFSSFIGVKTGLCKYEVNKSNYEVIIDKSVAKVRPYTACAVIKNISFNDEGIREIIQIQEKMHVTFGRNRKKVAIGIYPLDKINFPIRYMAKKPKDIKFRPLEYPKSINALKILSQHPTGRDYGHLLEGKEMFPIFMDAKDNILSMPPIINSHDIGKINTDTKELFIECSGFDLEVLKKCLNIIVTAFYDMGGKLYDVKLKYPKENHVTPDLKPKKKKIRLDYVNKYLGLDLKESELQALLLKMGYGYEKGNVLIPAYRADILHEIDFVEDIAIAYGYENFKAIIPKVATVAAENDMEKFSNKIAEVLVGANLLEVNSYNITDKKKQVDMMLVDVPVVELANALNIDYNSMRFWMTPGLLEVFSANKHNEYPQRIFEMGTCFKKDKKQETGVYEFRRLAVALTHLDTDYTEIRQVFDILMNSMNLQYEIKAIDHESFIPGRVARVSVQGVDVAYIGEIHPQVLTNFQLDYPVSCFELNLTDLLKVIRKQDI